MVFPLLIALTISLQPLVDENVLEPSVQNEVDHALSLAPTNKFEKTSASIDFAKLYQTNGLSATETAIALVSAQKSDGRWYFGTNEVTGAALMILRRLSGYPLEDSDDSERPDGAPAKGAREEARAESSKLEIIGNGR